MRYYITAVCIIILDQLVKWKTRASLPVGGSIPVIGDFFAITHVANTGAAFGMLAGRTGMLIVISGALIIIMIVLLALVLRKQSLHWSAKTAATMIVAGGIGNMIDRVLFGSVTDMVASADVDLVEIDMLMDDPVEGATAEQRLRARKKGVTVSSTAKKAKEQAAELQKEAPAEQDRGCA